MTILKMNWNHPRLFSQSLTSASGRSWETHPSLILVEGYPRYCQGWWQEDVVSRAGDHARHVSPPSHHMSRVSGPEIHCQEVDKVWGWRLQPISLTKMREEKSCRILRKNEDLTLKWSQKLGKHQPARHTHRQVRQVNGVREDPGIPRWSIVLTPAQAGRGECPDPDPCTPTELWPGHNSHSH